jgi:hypothetical protein
LSARLSDCPAFSEWQALVAGSASDEHRRHASKREQLGDLEGALSIYREVEAAAQAPHRATTRSAGSNR